MSTGSTPLVGVGVDASHQSLVALRWAAEYARALGARLRAVAPWRYPTTYGTAPDWSKMDVGYPFHCHVLHGSFEALRRAPWPVFGWLGEAAGAGAWPLHAGRFSRLRLWVGHELSVGQRLRADGILQQAVEQ